MHPSSAGRLCCSVSLFFGLFFGLFGWQFAGAASPAEQAACEALVKTPDLTITSAEIAPAAATTPEYCYIRGSISPAIRYHVQLPLPSRWNRRFLNWGDGGKDGDLDYADHRVAQGYAVANSNTGHDNGSEPGASFGYNNRQAEIDFGYRAVHLTVNAAKSAIRAYYGQAPQYSYHEGCSTGGRQGLMEAQRFPADFDGIVAGAPVNYYQELNASRVWIVQQVYADDLAGNLAYDTDGDGTPESLRKLEMLAEAVIERCDTSDGISDGVIEDPMQCDFDPRVHLAPMMCSKDANADNCFTSRQVDVVAHMYAGPRDSSGKTIHKGKAFGSELEWDSFPHVGNGLRPNANSLDHINYLFYETDPGVTPADLHDVSYAPRKAGPIPEYGWWEFDIQDVVAGKADLMRAITNATDPDLGRFIFDHGGKLLLYHGWADSGPSPEVTLDYYQDIVAVTFGGDLAKAREHARLFMIPGMYHCGRGPGPSEWDRLAPLVAWVEEGIAPSHLVGRHRTNGEVDNERRICPFPEKAVYTGVEGGQNDPANWVESNFTCRH
jgi:hypothetical protein